MGLYNLSLVKVWSQIVGVVTAYRSKLLSLFKNLCKYGILCPDDGDVVMITVAQYKAELFCLRRISHMRLPINLLYFPRVIKVLQDESLGFNSCSTESCRDWLSALSLVGIESQRDETL